jgi:eukaryotic-like serine/threonine-protein kinase
MLGEYVGNYRIDALIGSGETGEVYRATHSIMGKWVAIKILKLEFSSRWDVVARFFREARAIAQVGHSGTVDVLDTGRLQNGRAYLIMALLEGECLRDRIERGTLPAILQRSIARQAADVMAVAHARGVIHRDLSPGNIFLIPDSSEPGGVRIKILDFGVAKLIDDSASLRTRTAAILGSPAYMAPEQCRGAGHVDSRSDIYSLGCVMYEMATGRPPFQCANFTEYVVAHATTLPPPITTPIDARYAQLILHALSKQPGLRPASMQALSQSLDEL